MEELLACQVGCAAWLGGCLGGWMRACSLSWRCRAHVISSCGVVGQASTACDSQQPGPTARAHELPTPFTSHANRGCPCLCAAGDAPAAGGVVHAAVF